jgi:hypothetical protein
MSLHSWGATAVAEAREQPVADPGLAGRRAAGRVGGSGERKQEAHDQQSTDSIAANLTAGAGSPHRPWSDSIRVR